MGTPTPLNPATLRAMADFPDQLEQFYAAIPASHRNWIPPSWDGIPSETFSALGQVCHVRDIEIVAAFDVVKGKVGKDLSEAMWAHPNNTIKFTEVPHMGVRVHRGMTHDGLGKYVSTVVEKAPPETATSASRVMTFDAVSCQTCAAAPGAKFARFNATGVEPESTFEITMTVSAPSPARSAANTDRLSAFAVDVARTLVSPKVDRLPS